MPLWITLSLAALAPAGTLAGALGGQWVAARSSRAREQERVGAEKEARWEERRFEVLAEYVIVAETMIETLCHASFLVAEKRDLEKEVTDKLTMLENESKDAVSKLRLSVPPSLHFQCRVFHGFFHDTSFKIRHRSDPVIEDSHMSGNAFEQRLDQLIGHMQHELGIGDPYW